MRQFQRHHMVITLFVDIKCSERLEAVVRGVNGGL